MHAVIAAGAPSATKPRQIAASAAADAVATFSLLKSADSLPLEAPSAIAPNAAALIPETANTAPPKAADPGKAKPDSAAGGSTLAWLLSSLSSALTSAPAPATGEPMSSDPLASDHNGLTPVLAHGAAAQATASVEAPATPASQDGSAQAQGQAGVADPRSAAAPVGAVTATLAQVKPAEALPVQAVAAPDRAAPPSATPAPIVPSDPLMSGLLAGPIAGATPAAATPVLAHTALDLTQANWPTALAEHVHWQILDGVQEALLELNPRELGSVQVHVRLTGNDAQVQFSATHPLMREVLSAGLPQLRALLADGGLQLSQAQVGGQGQPSRQPRAPRVASRPVGTAAEGDEVPALAQTRTRVLHIGLVDDFA